MKIHEVEQGSEEWLNLRLGIVTASAMDKIITKTGKASGQSPKYMARLVAEWYIGRPLEDAKSAFMERGTELEPQARAMYEFQNDCTVRQVGFCTSDDGKVGCSPDGLVGNDGGLEIKSLGIEAHMLYLIGGVPDDHMIQVYGNLLVTGRKWWDLYCPHPMLPPVIKRFTRDEEFLDAMAGYIDVFNGDMADAKARLAPLRDARLAALAAAAEAEGDGQEMLL